MERSEGRRDRERVGPERATARGMGRGRAARRAALGAALLAGLLSGLAGCAGPADPERRAAQREAAALQARSAGLREARGSTIWDLFRPTEDPDARIEVNRFVWNAALEVLDFMPIEAVDPFTGVIVMGFGTPPGGATPYRATVYVQDPALDARALNVALATRAGPASAEAQRAVEDAILTRARQLRIAAGRL